MQALQDVGVDVNSRFLHTYILCMPFNRYMLVLQCVCVCVCVCGDDDDDDDDDVLQVNKCMAYSLRIEARDIVPCSDFTIDGFGCFASDLQQVCMYACTYALWVD